MIPRLLFEGPVRLAIVLVVAVFLLIVIWSRVRSRATGRMVGAGIAAIPLLLAVNHLVVTPREALIELCGKLAGLVDEGQGSAVAAYLSDDFEAGGLDRDAFIDRLEDRLKRFRVDDPRLSGFDVSLPTPNDGLAEFDVACSIRSVDAFLDRVLTRWKLTFRRRGDRWRVVRIDAVPTPFSPFRDLRRWID